MEKSSKFLFYEKQARKLLISNYNKKYYIDYNKKIINNIMWNAKEHLVSIFKDYLIFDELAEFCADFYPQEKSIKKLNDLFSYYSESSFIFPNYTPLPESKYIYKSIIKKQRVIDEQENLEELKIKQKKLKEKKNNIFFNFYNDSGTESKFFNSTIYNSILKPSESLLKILFGIENQKINSKYNKNSSYYLNKNFISNNEDSINNSNFYDEYIENYNTGEFQEEIYDKNKIKDESEWDEEIDDIIKIVKIIYKNEKKKSINMTIKDFIKNNKNNNNKIKIKLGLLPNNNNYSIINKTDNNKIEKNILNNYKSNNILKKISNISGMNMNKNSGIYNFTKKIKNNLNVLNFNSKNKNDLQENITNAEGKNPFLITNYNFKKCNLNNNNQINNKEQKHKKVKSTFCFNDFNNNDYLIRLNTNNGNAINNNYIEYFNTPTTKRTQTLSKNINNYKLNKKSDNNIININININKTNLYVNSQDKNNIYQKNKNYPKIVPKLDINSITNIISNDNISKEKNRKSNSIKNKNSKKILSLNNYNNYYKNNNLTERNLMKNGQTPVKAQFKLNEKFKLMLGLNANNKKIVFRRQQNDMDKNKLYFNERNNTLKLNNNYINRKKFNNGTNSNKSQNKGKNKVLLTESLTKIKISDYYTDRNNYLSLK